MNKASTNFQSIILNLQQFWADKGCLIWQPYYSQVGAGTYNPATVLRVLGPEPWNVAYVEPSIRPDDGRYGENPNRMQQHYQYQVILKPDPGNPQELYLESLEALGIDPRQHDIRFVEDNWESPALGAWGLGWEVWLDGQEITQFTYFQQAGGMALNPVSVELTYGLERIAIALQRVRSFRDIRWTDQRTYGDVNLQGEWEHSKYYFEIADVDRLRQMFDLFEKEAISSLEHGLVLPAHDYVLKCSHTFNVMDTRGAVGVTERQAMFSRMRELSRRVAETYYNQRQALGFPWLPKEESEEKLNRSPETISSQVVDSAPFLFEIGTEELPVADLDDALAQLRTAIPQFLEQNRLSYTGLTIEGTPRRLVVYVEKLAGKQPDVTVIVKGPPANKAFDSDGKQTGAAIGFARSRGIAVENLLIQEMDGGRYAVAVVDEVGKSAIQVLAEGLPAVIAGIKFTKSMRWNDEKLAFSRPIRWIVALFGDNIIPFEYAKLPSGRMTRGLRFHDPETIVITSPQDYFNALSSQGIILAQEKRKQAILDQIINLLDKVGGEYRFDEELLQEVTNLVEAPMAFLGSFAEEHLRLPADVLISVMKKHQRYFPVWSKNHELLPYFIGVRNGDGEYLDVVTDGNEQVIQARFADANFFIREDMQHRLEDRLPRLGTLTFQIKLGSMLDKSRRIKQLVEKLYPMFQFPEVYYQPSLRAAELCKADLVTHMVVEMTSLQGLMGKYYALHDGEDPLVANALFEHYLPRFAGDTYPTTIPGFVIGLADRLDTLAGLFAANMAPTGTKDPFALRRAALGLVQNLIKWNVDFDLEKGLDMAGEILPIPASHKTQKDCLEFIIGRMRNYFIEQEYRYDIVDAVLAAQGNNPAGAYAAINELTKWVEREDWRQILPAYSRCVRITRDQQEKYDVNPSLFKYQEEKELFEAINTLEAQYKKTGSMNEFLSAFLPVIPIINRFFDTVLVMSEDPLERSNRLGMLQKLSALSTHLADFSLLEGF